MAATDSFVWDKPGALSSAAGKLSSPPAPDRPRVSREDRDMGFSKDDDSDDWSSVVARSKVKGNPCGLKRQDLMEIKHNLRAQRGIAAMWPFVADILESDSLSKDDISFVATVAVAVDKVAAADADEIRAAALSAYKAAAAAYKAAAAPRVEELKPETKAPRDNPPRNPADVDVRHVPINHELELKMWCEKARKALEYYNDTKGEEFELVEMENYEAAILPPYMLYHITFMARRKYMSDSCPELFFAELYEKFHLDGKFVVKMCMILDPSGQDVQKGCGYVQGDKDMLHPKGVKFFAGPPGEHGLGSSSPDAR